MPSSLLDAVTDAIRFAKSDDRERPALPLLLHYAETGNLDGAHPTAKLLNALQADARLSIFAGRMQVVPGHAARVEYSTLAGWLIRRGMEVGAANAILDLERYLVTESIEYQLIVAVDGLEVETALEVGPYHIVPWLALPATA